MADRELSPSFDIGTVVMCPDGHEVCDVISPLYKGMTGYSECVGNWRSDQQVPQRGDPVPLLCKCGKPYTNAVGNYFPWTIVKQHA